MAVNLKKPLASELLPVHGVELYVGQAGIKKTGKDDVTLITLCPGAAVTAVFTRNQFAAAPVYVSKQHLCAGKEIKALIINTGNANAGTGAAGRKDAEQICTAVAAKLNCAPVQVLPFSTGVIMEKLPAEKITAVLPHLKTADWLTAALAIMTTDTVPKACSSSCNLGGTEVTVTGIAKGSGMIEPNMATMLAFVATDAKISRPVLACLSREIVADSFNAITVDGDTSTNDSFVLIATGKSTAAVIDDTGSKAYAALKLAAGEVVQRLATAIVRDGEGATKFITLKVSAAATRAEARQVAYSVARSPLVKTAFFASDANLGRIICAVGNAGIADLAVGKISMYLDGLLVVSKGGVAIGYNDAAGQKIMAQAEITVHIVLNRGEAAAVVYTCDLSHQYIKINADYRT